MTNFNKYHWWGIKTVPKCLIKSTQLIFNVESEYIIRISLSRQDFEIFEVMCSKNGVLRNFWASVQGARNFFGFFLKCHHLALLFPFKMSCWSHERFFVTKIRPYQVFTFIRTTLWAFSSPFWNGRPSCKWKCLSCDPIFVINNSETPE